MQSFADYVTNNSNGAVPTASQNQYFQDQYKKEGDRETNMQGIQDWEQSRNPYYSNLYQQQVSSGNQAIQQQYSDSLKQMQLQHMSRGTNGGSQDMYNQTQLGSHFNQMSARNAQQAQNNVQGLRRNDQDRATQMRMNQYSEDPIMARYYDSLMNSNGMDGDKYSQYFQGRGVYDQINQDYKNNMSQSYGQLIGAGFNGASLAMGA